MSASSNSPIGLVGTMITASRGEAGPGEVKLKIRGGTEHFIARSREAIDVGASVMVVAELGPLTVEVLPWDDPFSSTEAL